jgi:hypothetical protein
VQHIAPNDRLMQIATREAGVFQWFGDLTYHLKLRCARTSKLDQLEQRSLVWTRSRDRSRRIYSDGSAIPSST